MPGRKVGRTGYSDIPDQSRTNGNLSADELDNRNEAGDKFREALYFPGTTREESRKGCGDQWVLACQLDAR